MPLTASPQFEGDKSAAPRSATDSALFWFTLFAIAGMVALALIAPKYARRQQRIERMADARARVARNANIDSNVTAEAPYSPSDANTESRFSLQPLVLVIECLLLACVTLLSITQIRRARRARLDQLSQPNHTT